MQYRWPVSDTGLVNNAGLNAINMLYDDSHFLAAARLTSSVVLDSTELEF